MEMALPSWRPLSLASPCLPGLSPPHFDVSKSPEALAREIAPVIGILCVQGWSREQTGLSILWNFKEIGYNPFPLPHLFPEVSSSPCLGEFCHWNFPLLQLPSACVSFET